MPKSSYVPKIEDLQLRTCSINFFSLHQPLFLSPLVRWCGAEEVVTELDEVDADWLLYAELVVADWTLVAAEWLFSR